MAITPNNPQFASANALLFNYNNWASGVVDLDRGWSTPYILFDAINQSKSFGISDDEGGKLRVLTMPRAEVVQTVATVTQSGANLILTWADNTYDSFRDKELVRDDDGNQGLVISHAPGTVTIQPATYPTALVSTSHFLANASVTSLGIASGNYYSTGVTSLYKSKVPRYNYAGVTRESHTMARGEKFFTFKGQDGVAYYYTEGETQMVKRFMKNNMKKYIFSEPGVFTGPEGETNLTQGFRAAVRDQGGLFLSQTSNFTRAQFEGWIDFVKSKTPGMYQDFVIWCGTAAWSTISGFYTTEMNFTTSTREIGGQNINIDVKQITFKGVTFKVMIGDMFDDNVMWPKLSTISGVTGTKMSNTLCILNLAPVPDANGGGLIPSCRKFHWSTDGRGDMETIYKVIPGMTGPGAGNDTGPNLWNNYQMTASNVDGVTFEMLAHNGIDFTADGCVWFELAD